MRYNKLARPEVQTNRRGQMHEELFRHAQVLRKIKPFDWGDSRLGIRRSDIDVFKAAALAFNHIILVRATNPESLKYIGNKNMYPKPIDCKAKTADCNVYIPFSCGPVIHAKTAGLVVDPTLVGARAFKEGRYAKAVEAWNDFLKDKTPDERSKKIFKRHGSEKGCFAVDTDINSKYYGCLMISTEDESPSFGKAALAATPRWGNNHARLEGAQCSMRMRYIHGDYDLYALLNLDNLNERRLENVVYGVKNYYSPKLEAIQDFINKGIGTPMIQHGDQFRYKHQSDKIYAFYPNNTVYIIDESTASIEEIFEIIYGVA
jgi:hypothetical protein